MSVEFGLEREVTEAGDVALSVGDGNVTVWFVVSAAADPLVRLSQAALAVLESAGATQVVIADDLASWTWSLTLEADKVRVAVSGTAAQCELDLGVEGLVTQARLAEVLRAALEGVEGETTTSLTERLGRWAEA